jgi:hypothetical protein
VNPSITAPPGQRRSSIITTLEVYFTAQVVPAGEGLCYSDQALMPTCR